MRSYKQYCAIALALDRVGDRWTLLIVRELLGGAKRFSDLMGGLPGIATNLLASRLRRMEEDGLIAHSFAPAPVSAEVYELTELGTGLRGALEALMMWAARWMAHRSPQQEFRAHWLVIALRPMIADRRVGRLTAAIEVPEGTIGVRSDEEADGRVTLSGEPPKNPACTLRAPAELVLGMAAGAISWPEAADRGAQLRGADSAGALLLKALGAA